MNELLYLFPHIGFLPLSTIEAPTLLAALRKVEKLTLLFTRRHHAKTTGKRGDEPELARQEPWAPFWSRQGECPTWQEVSPAQEPAQSGILKSWPRLSKHGLTSSALTLSHHA